MAQAAGGDEAYVVARTHHLAHRQHLLPAGLRRRVTCPLQRLDQVRRHGVVGGGEVAVDGAAEVLQGVHAFLPIALALLVDGLHPLAHGVAVQVDHRQVVVLPGQLLPVGGQGPALGHLDGERGDLVVLGGPKTLLGVLHPKGLAPEGGLPPGLLLLQGGGQGGQVLPRGFRRVIGADLDEQLHGRKILQHPLRQLPGEVPGGLQAVELEHRVAAAGVDEVGFPAIALRAGQLEKIGAGAAFTAAVSVVDAVVGHKPDLLRAPDVVAQLPAAEDVSLLLGDLQDHQIFFHGFPPPPLPWSGQLFIFVLPVALLQFPKAVINGVPGAITHLKAV